MKKSSKIFIGLIIIILLIGAEAGQIYNESISANSRSEEMKIAGDFIITDIEPPKKPYSLKNLVIELQNVTINQNDTDGDGLYDSVEAVLGTDFNNTDSDFDNLNDSYEVDQGLDPLNPDTNEDGLPDYHEVTDVYSLDLDSDGTPNTWDFDNDGDGVNDRLDLSPAAKSTTDNLFTFDIETDGNPLLLTFQVRPQNPEHLKLVDQNWNWPWDNESTMQDLDNSKEDVIMTPWLRLSTTSLPTQDAVTDYGVLVTSTAMEVTLNPNREYGSVVAFTGKIFHPAPPASLSIDVELLWKVSGFSDGVAKALQAGNGMYVTIGADSKAVANTSAVSEGLLRWYDLGNNEIALKVFNGPYLSVADDGTLVANGTTISSKETFALNYVSGNSATLRAYNNYYLMVRPDGVLVANSSAAVQYTVLDQGYAPEVTPLVTYTDNFLITGLSIEESFSSDIGLFYSDNKSQTIAANLIMDYIFLRNGTTTVWDMPAMLSDYNITVSNRTESFVEKNEAFVQAGNELIPAILQSLPENKTLPIIIANEDNSKTLDLSDLPFGSYIIGDTTSANLTAAPIITAKTMKMNFYNSSSQTMFMAQEILFEIDSWGLDDNTTLDLMTLVWKWYLGQQVVTKVDGIPTDFSDFLPEISIQNCAPGIAVLGLDVIGGTFTTAGIAIIETKASKTAKFLYELNEELIKKGWSISIGGQKWASAKFNFQGQKQAQILKSSKSYKVLKGISTALVVIDVIASLVFFGLSIYSACKTAEAYREALDDAYGDEFLALHVVVATLFYGLLIGLTIALAVSGVGAPLAIVLGLLLAVFGFFLDWLIGALVGLIFGSPTDHYHAEPALDVEGSPETSIDDYDNNGLDVGDRINVITHLIGIINGAGSNPTLRDPSYIVPWTRIVAPSGTSSTISPALNETLKSYSPYEWEDHTPLLDRTSSVEVNSTRLEERYDSTAWIKPGIGMINFPAKIQLNAEYHLRQIYYHKWLGLFKCWHHKWNDGQTTTSTLTTLYFDVLPGTLDGFLRWKQISRNDRDGDGLNDTIEETLGISDKKRYDSDADGLNDKFEMDMGIKPDYCDTDEDGLIDKYEFVYALNASDGDTDGDGIYDYLELAGWIISFNYSDQLFEMRVFSNPALNDTDGDGISDGDEYWSGLNPRSADTNGDGTPDVAVPQTEIIALLKNTTDIANDIMNTSCTISHIAVDSDGYVYAAVIGSTGNYSILVLDSNLTYYNNWSLDFYPMQVVVDNENDTLYVLYYSPSYPHYHIISYYYNGTNASNPINLDFMAIEPDCIGMDVDSSGNLYLAYVAIIDEAWAAGIRKYAPDGTLLTTYGSYGIAPDQFTELKDLAVDEVYGYIYALDGDRVMRLNETDGSFITTIPNGYGQIVDLAVDPDGWVYILDQFDSAVGEGCVRRFDQNGMEDRNFILTDSNETKPWMLVHYPIRFGIDSSKNFYVLENNSLDYPNPKLLKFDWNETLVPPYIPNDKYDWDGDGLGNLREVLGWNTSFVNNETVTTLFVTSEYLLKDTDFDGLSDYYENLSKSNPRDPDTDGDGLSDLYEWELGTNITNDDTDGDNLTDSDEILIGSDPISLWDTDSDGLTDYQEFYLNSDPTKNDTDDDGALDLQEFLGNSSLLNPDSDDDFMFDGLEYMLNCDPNDPDTDDDDLIDGEELIHGTNATDPDTDDDGAIDGLEVDLWLDPHDPDCDDDTLLDWTELYWGSNPLNNDTDGDGVPDNLDNDTLLTFTAPIILAYNPDPYDANLLFAQNLALVGNVTVVSFADFMANHTNATYIVLVGRPAPENNTLSGLIYNLTADTGTMLAAMMAPDSYQMMVRYGIWKSTQTVIILSQAYPLDGYKIFSEVKAKNVTIFNNSVVVEYLTTPIFHNETAYNYGFELEELDTVKISDAILSVTFENWTRPTIQLTKYNQNSTPYPLTTTNGLGFGEKALGKYLDVMMFALNGSRITTCQEATLIFLIRFEDLDIDGNGFITDPWDIREEGLKLFYYDEITGTWKIISTDLDWVLDFRINTTDFELFGETFMGFIWVRVTHLSLFTAGGLQNAPYWDYIWLFIFIGLAIVGASVVIYTQRKKITVVAKKLRRRPMDNIQWEIQDSALTLKFDITKEFGESKSGKTIIVANSHGGWHFKGTDLSLGMVAYKYPTTKELKKKPKHEMQNIEFKLEENTAILTIDTTKDFGLSSTGKSKIVASSRGNHHVEGTTIYFGVNIYKKIKISQAAEPIPKDVPLKKIAVAPTTEKPIPKTTEPPAQKPTIAEKKQPIAKKKEPIPDKKQPIEEKKPSSDAKKEVVVEKTPPKLELTDIPGIGLVKLQSLYKAEIYTIEDLINCDPKEAAGKVTGLGVQTLNKWIAQAKELLKRRS